MKNVAEYLKNLGFSANETKLYLTLIASGPMTVSDLAKTAHINRTATYAHINTLIEKGIMHEQRKGSLKLLAAIEPERLHYLIDNKLEEISSLKREFPNIIQTINESLKNNHQEENVDIQYYKGKMGVRKIYIETLKAKEIRSYVNVEEIAKAFPKNYQLLDMAYKSNPKIKIFEICEESPKTRERLKLTNKNHFYKVLPKHLKLTSQDVLIYDNKIAIIDLKGETNGIVLHRLDLSKNFQLLFDLLWNMLPEET